MLLGEAVPVALTLGDKVTGDVVLVSGDMQGVARAIGRSRAVMRNIRQNLILAFGDNIALIPVANGGFGAVWRAGAVANAGGGGDGRKFNFFAGQCAAPAPLSRKGYSLNLSYRFLPKNKAKPFHSRRCLR